jgi:hypothetical protein
MHPMMSLKPILIAGLSLLGFGIFAQNKTISDKKKDERGQAVKSKVMVIPFEPRLYLGEVDYAINAETKLSAKQIKFQFRDGLNEQITKALKSAKYGVLDLMEDTLKYKKDTDLIYGALRYEYLKVPDQNNYQVPKKEKSAKPIEKGQLTLETNSDVRFMNAKLTNAKVVPQLFGKYKTDVFVFINQLDIKAGGNNEAAQPYKVPSTKRKIIVHYTVFTKDGTEINSGILEDEFAEDLNVPKKIIDKHFSKLSLELVMRITKALNPLATK